MIRFSNFPFKDEMAKGQDSKKNQDKSQAKNHRKKVEEKRLHRDQLMWSGLVAVLLSVMALWKWSAPKNVLIEQDRAPASYKTEPVQDLLQR